MQIRLTRKFAEAIDGIDLSHHAVGDVFNLSSADARLLVAEGWASTSLHPDRRPNRPAEAAEAADLQRHRSPKRRT
jgi:hypothetical protein